MVYEKFYMFVCRCMVAVDEILSDKFLSLIWFVSLSEFYNRLSKYASKFYWLLYLPDYRDLGLNR